MLPLIIDVDEPLWSLLAWAALLATIGSGLGAKVTSGLGAGTPTVALEPPCEAPL